MAVADPLEFALATLGYRHGEGLVERDVNHVDPARQFIWRDLVRKTEVTAAYFRGSVPLVAFARAQDEAVPAVQRQLWNFGRIPLLITGTPSVIGVYSCYSPPLSLDDAGSTALTVASLGDDLLAEALAPFSRAEVESGRLVTERPDFFRRKDRVDRRLLANLRQLRARLAGAPAKNRAVDALIGRSIFIRYLEDRGVLTEDHFNELAPFSVYTDVLEAGIEPSYALFAMLARKFDGDIFATMADEAAQLNGEDLQVLAEFLEGGDVATGQTSFWPYDFSVIPPELMSSIYEQLLKESQELDAAYYTPRTVVDLILDEVLPWGDHGVERRRRILDPACGSGIFLTEAYRRLVFSASDSGKRKLSFSELSDLLTSSIYGIDRSAAAVRVAAFGLYLALLEEIDPPTAWTHAKLPQLIDRNLMIQDFFDTAPFERSAFDAIVGNPPWKSELHARAENYVRDRQLPVADRQLAHAFLWRAADFLAGDGRLGLLLPAKLLHNKSARAVAVREHLFETLNVETIVDLSVLRRNLFEAAVAPAAAVVASRQEDGVTSGRSEEGVVHVALRNSPFQDAVDGLVVSPHDIHKVSKRLARSRPDVWKTLLWGDERDVDLISRLRSRHGPLRDIVRERRWPHGQGFQIKGGDRNAADALARQPFVRTTSIRPFQAALETEIRLPAVMHRPRDPRLYKGPHVLVRRGLVDGRPAAALLHADAAFNNGVFGLAAPSEDADYLRLVTACINSDVGAYYQFLTSASWGVERDFVEENEHLSLPIPELENPATRYVLELMHAAERAARWDAPWWHQLNDAVFGAYEIGDAADQIRALLEISLDQFRRGAQAVSFQPPSSQQRRAYARALRRALRDTLGAAVRDVAISMLDSAYLIATVTFADAPDQQVSLRQSVAELNALIRKALDQAASWPSPVVILEPAALLLQGDQVHVLRPTQVRYWTTARARADAAEIIGEVTRLDARPAA